jgi:excisionase family DNA binding protein
MQKLARGKTSFFPPILGANATRCPSPEGIGAAAARWDVDGDSDDAGRSLLDELMTSSQVAPLLQMRLSTVESYARRGLLPSAKVGRHRRLVCSQVEQALTALSRARRRRALRLPTPRVTRDGQAGPVPL